MQKLTMSMCASRDYLQGYNKAVDDASKEVDALRARVAELESGIKTALTEIEGGCYADAHSTISSLWVSRIMSHNPRKDANANSYRLY